MSATVVRQMPDTHHWCPADGCHVLVPPDRLMCGRHWLWVPLALREAYWRAWDDGRGAGLPDTNDCGWRCVLAAHY